MSDELQAFREHVDVRFGEMHERLERIDTSLHLVYQNQIDHSDTHAETATKGQATGISAVVAAVVAAFASIFGRHLG